MRRVRTASLALAILAGPVTAQETQEERDVGFIQGLIEDNLSGDNVTVRIEGFEGALSSRATVGELTVADADGVWLRATGLALDWNRSALLGGAVEVNEMSAETIEFLRAPNTDEAATLPDAQAEPFVFALPDLPVSIDIALIAADRIVLGAPFLGREYAFSVDGSVSLDGGEGAVNIVAERLDATVGSFAIAGAYSEDTDVLALTLDLQEEEEGIVARALGIPGRPSVRLLLNGEAPIDDYAATLSIATAGTERIAGAFGLVTVTGADGTSAQDLRLDISGDLSSLVDSEYAAFFGTSSRLAVQGGRDGSGAVSLRALEIEAQAVQLSGSAEISPEGWPRVLDLDGRIAGPDGAPVLLPGAGAQTFVDSVTLDLSYGAAAGDAWTGVFAIENLRHPAVTIPELALDGSGIIVPETAAGGDGRFTADLAYGATGMALTDAAVAEALGAAVEGRIVFARTGDDPLVIDAVTLTGPGVDLAAAGAITGPADGFETRLTATLGAGDLARFARLTGLDLAGQAQVDITAMLRPLDGIFDVSLDGTTQDLALGIDALDPLLAGAGSLDLVAARDTDGTRLERLDVVTDEATLAATADVTRRGVAAVFALDIRDVGLALPGLDGAAQVRGTAETGTDGYTLVSATAALPGTAADIRATLPPGDSAEPAIIDVSLDVADLAPFSPLAGRDLAGALDVTLTGTAALDGTAADLVITGAGSDLSVAIAQADPFLAGETQLQGRLLRTGPLSARLEDFTLVSPTLALLASADFDEGAGRAEFSLSVDDVAPALPDLTGALRLQGAVSRDAAGRITATTTGTGPGGADLDLAADLGPGFDLAANGTVQIDDLSPFSALAGQPLGGAVDLTFSGSVADGGAVTQSAFDVVFDLAASDIAAGERALAGDLAARGIASRTAGGALTLLASADGPGGLDLDVSGTMAPRDAASALEGTVSLVASDLGAWAALLGQPLSGSLDLSAEGTALPDASAFDVTFDLAGADLGGLGYALGGAVTAAGTATRTPDGVTRLLADATGPGAAAIDLDATLASAADGGQISGAFSAQVGSLAPYSDLAGRSLAGALAAQVSGTAWPDLSGFDVDFDLTGSDLAAGGTALPGGLTARGQALRQTDGPVSVTLDAQGPGGATVRLTAAGTETIAVDLAASVDSLSTYAGLAGRPLAGGIDATLRGTTTIDLATLDMALSLRTRSIDVGVPALRPLLAGVGTLNGQVSRSADGTARARTVDIAFPAFSVTGAFDQSGGAGGGTFTARLNDIGLFTETLSGSATATGTARLQPDGGVALDIDATGPGGVQASVAGTVAPGGTLALSLNGQAPLDLANLFIAPLTLSGQAGVALSINGPPALSSVTGAVTLRDGRLFSPRLGRALQDIGGTVQLTGGQAVLDIGAGLEAGGRLAISGPVGLTGPNTADLRVVADGLILRDPTLFETTADGVITVTGPLAGGARIAGSIDIGETELRVPSSGISVLGDLPEVRHIGAPSDVRQTLDRAGLTVAGVEATAGNGGGTAGPVYGIDIVIRAPARIFIRGRGVDAELGGELALTGTTAQIIPAGQFELVRGRVDILGQRFVLNEGGAFLQGDFVPYIRLVATTEAEDGTVVSIIIDGPADDPEVTFTSQPELPQDEVLARLLFGRDLSSISPLQAVQLAAAVSTLAGTGGGGLIDDFRSGVGLDNLDIVTDDAGGVGVQAGAYISENIYTDVVVGSDTTEITLNLDLTDDITVTGKTGTDGDTSIGIFFERDY